MEKILPARVGRLESKFNEVSKHDSAFIIIIKFYPISALV